MTITERMFPTATDDAHELGIVREKMQQIWNHYGGRPAIEHPEYKRLQARERELSARVFPRWHR